MKQPNKKRHRSLPEFATSCRGKGFVVGASRPMHSAAQGQNRAGAGPRLNEAFRARLREATCPSRAVPCTTSTSPVVRATRYKQGTMSALCRQYLAGTYEIPRRDRRESTYSPCSSKRGGISGSLSSIVSVPPIVPMLSRFSPAFRRVAWPGPGPKRPIWSCLFVQYRGKYLLIRQ